MWGHKVPGEIQLCMLNAMGLDILQLPHSMLFSFISLPLSLLRSDAKCGICQVPPRYP